MKKRHWIVTFFIVLGILSCTSEEGPTMLSPDFAMEDASGITRISATIFGNILPVGNGVIQESGVVYSTESDMANKMIAKSNTPDNVDIILSELAPGTTYYYTLYALSGFSMAFSDDIRSFKTLDRYIPTIGNFHVLVSSLQSIKLFCGIMDDGGTTVIRGGFGYKPADSREEWKEVDAKFKGDSFEAEIFNLSLGTEYLFYAYLINEEGRVQSDTINASTNDSMTPLLGDAKVLEVQGSWARLQGQVVDEGFSEINEYGFCYSSIEEMPVIENSSTLGYDLSKDGIYNGLITGCSPNTIYYCRSYARNADGIGYGALFSFVTGDLKTPSLGKNYVYELTSSSIQLSAQYNDGGGFLSGQWFCYSADNTEPKIENSSLAVAQKVDNENGTFSIVGTIQNLQPAAVYYMCPVIVVDGEKYYGDILSVITKNADGTEPYMGTSFSAMNFLGTGGSQILNIYSNIEWHVESVPKWVHLSETSGQNDGSITVSVDENLEVGSRSASLHIISSMRTIEVLLVQNGGEVTFAVSPTDMNVGSSAYSESVKIYSNVSWKIDMTTVPVWMNFTEYSGDSDSDIVLNIEENNQTQERIAHIRFITNFEEVILVVKQEKKTLNSGADVGDMGDGGSLN